MIRVFVVDDSTFFRKALIRVLSTDPNIKIVGEAASGIDALNRIHRAHVDLVTLDVDMPGMDGLQTLKGLLNRNPKLRVVVLSALAQNGAAITLDALEMGAVDFIDKSSFSILEFDRLARELIERITALKRRTAPSDRALRVQNQRDDATPNVKAPIHIQWDRYHLCVIGASTGGPTAIQTLLEAMPRTFPVPVIIVQHMPVGFTAPFSERLKMHCALLVVEGKNNEALTPGKCVVAPAGVSCEIDPNLCLRLGAAPTRSKFKPSVDQVMQSAAQVCKDKVVGILLTGMGDDGAKGMRAIFKAGGTTIGESEETCIVFGMPRAAHEMGVLNHLLSRHSIAQLLR